MGEQPFAVRVRSHAERGRELYTSAAAPAGACLLRCLPFALVPADACLATHCARCLASTALLHRCADACGLALCVACSLDASWRTVHRSGECVSLRALWQLLDCAPGGGEKETAGLRLLLRTRYAALCDDLPPPSCEEGDALSDGPDSLPSLVSHWEDVSDAQRESAFALAETARFVLVASARASREVLAELACTLAANAFDLVDAESGLSLGEGLYPSIAVCVQHSCEPSADFVVETGANNGALALRSLRALRSAEMVSISYASNFPSTADRRRHLSDAYCFECLCPRCKAGDGAPHILPLARALREAATPAAVRAAAQALVAAVQPLVDGGADWARLTLARGKWALLRETGRVPERRALAEELERLLGEAHPWPRSVRLGL